jgi:hypothetical protein
MKAVLVATIGTRDLMFQVSSGSWCNLGDDRMKDGDKFGEQFEVLSDLCLGSKTYRQLTQHLLERIEIYRQRIKPVIIGKLINDKAVDIDKIYLIGTNQNQEVSEREKDTLYTCELIKNWVEHQYQHKIPVEVIHLGIDGTNPAHFEQMFAWWRNIWRNQIEIKINQLIWVCLKGGVGQTSEAARISGLSMFGERIQYFEFKSNNTVANRAGISSEYTGPFLGTNYLWDRTRQQALNLLERYDYAAVLKLLQPYHQQDTSGWSATPKLLKAGSTWNQGEFETFLNQAKDALSREQLYQGASFWWQAYEEAYLAIIRLEQNNTTEAMFHSFRAVEGLLYMWAKEIFSQAVTDPPNKFPILSKSIIHKYPILKQEFTESSEIELNLWRMRRLVEAIIPKVTYEQDFNVFWDNARIARNNLFHRIDGLTEKQVFQAWGEDINNRKAWENRILSCLNLATGNNFKSLERASLFASIHQRVKQAIENYQPIAVK